MKTIIKNITRKIGFEITRYRPNVYDGACVSLRTEEHPKGDVLVSYIIDPFLLKPGQPVPNTHTNYWESLQIARTFLDIGYNVDAISFLDRSFIPQKNYSVVLDVRHNLERITPLLNKECLKIMHIDLCHILFQNAAEANRLLALQRRKGVTLKPRRFETPNLGIEYADCATILGNEFTINTFKYANKPIYQTPLATNIVYPWPEDKTYETCKKNYMWFGSGGLVRKGLDLVLDAFCEMPDYHLFICGPIKQEEDFEKAYYRELYETPNIHTIGWVDISSAEFKEITNKCIGLIYPSCAEGQAGSVVTCMHAGLIPVISYESGVDVDDFGIILSDCSLATIKNTIQKVSSLPAEELQLMAQKTWQFARANHTREKFAEEFRKIMSKVLAG